MSLCNCCKRAISQEQVESEISLLIKFVGNEINMFNDKQNNIQQLIQNIVLKEDLQLQAKQFIKNNKRIESLKIINDSLFEFQQAWRLKSETSVENASNILYKIELFNSKDQQRILSLMEKLGYKIDLEQIDSQLIHLQMNQISKDEINKVIQLQFKKSINEGDK
ncbi:Hypothetical_protein [Hexamita inflata]|uniref:Hypothetical_protein n=1 Tax=Hexamita inflata TaxID=28002 RepID=A0AA86R6M6_9EUKA|nr:Hypothetical protein HINF_LOCUS54667 [Hexamita inflata]